MTTSENGGVRRTRFGVAEWVGIATFCSIILGGYVLLTNKVYQHDAVIEALVRNADAERDKVSSQRDTLTELKTLIAVTTSTSEVRRQQLSTLTDSMNSMIGDQKVMRRDLSEMKNDIQELKDKP